MPIIFLKISPASSGLRASFTPPPLPPPPACIWAFTPPTPLPEAISSRAAATASSADCTSLPRGTATPCARRISLAWYSWIFMAAAQYNAAPGRGWCVERAGFTTPKKFGWAGSRAIESSIAGQGGTLQFRLGLLAALLISRPVAAMDMDDMLELHFGADVEGGKRFGDTATPSEFNLGVIDTMIHGRLSRAFSALAEIVYEDAGGQFGFDVERIILNYEPRAWFRLSVGRFHSPLGYWNTAYHHARWMYVSTRAPLLAHFEDDQGPLPTHTIGVL